MQLDEQQPFRFLVHDRDTKFSRAFDDVFPTEGIRVIRTPVQAPNANAHAERWVRTVRADCLDRILILGRRHLEHVLRVYRLHYNEHRPHRALRIAPCASRRQMVATQRRSKRPLAYTGAISSADSSTNTRPLEFANPTGCFCGLSASSGPTVALSRWRPTTYHVPRSDVAMICAAPTRTREPIRGPIRPREANFGRG